jgi:DNA mismatch repair protein PMS2
MARREIQVEEDELESEEEVVVLHAHPDVNQSRRRARQPISDDESAGASSPPPSRQNRVVSNVSPHMTAPSHRSGSPRPEAEEDENDKHSGVPDPDNSLSSDEWLVQTDADVTMRTAKSISSAGESILGRSRLSLTPTPPVVSDESDDDDITYLAANSSAITQGQSLQPAPSFRDEIKSTAANGEVTLSFDMDRLHDRRRKRRKLNAVGGTTAPSRDAYSILTQGGISSAAGIANKDLASAEEALSRVISKADFEQMEVLGQFNKGFIIARLRRVGGERTRGTDDLFIIDQHASDEKYNFETLQQTTVIKAQSLIRYVFSRLRETTAEPPRPRPLQLTAGDEIVAVENLEILRSNGFEVEIDEDQIPGRGERVKLSAMPVSKETTFDFKG